jgi:L-ascorbate metabolism protein UlaG (beta-lactamase superfamily)
MIGHSSVLIETNELKILTDPFFGTRGNVTYQRIDRPSRTRQGLRDVNLVLLSHNHWDHTDISYFRSLPNTTPIIAPWLTSRETRLLGAHQVAGLKPWESRSYGEFTVTAVPAIHITIANGYVIQSEGKCIYFAGDTEHGVFMQEIAQRFNLDVALMPVTTFPIPMTMGEDGAVRAVKDLAPRVIIPIHLGIQPRLPFLRSRQSVEGFERKLRAAGLKSKVVVLKAGEVMLV